MRVVHPALSGGVDTMRKLIGFVTAAATVLSLGLAGVSTAQAAPKKPILRRPTSRRRSSGASARPPRCSSSAPSAGTWSCRSTTRTRRARRSCSPCHGCCTRRPLGLPGGHARQPGRAGWLRARSTPSWASSSRTGPATPTTGSASTRAAWARASPRSRVTGPAPTARGRRTSPRRRPIMNQWVVEVEGLREGVHACRRPVAVQPREDHRHDRGHGEPADRARRRRRSTSTDSPTAPTSPACT